MNYKIVILLLLIKNFLLDDFKDLLLSLSENYRDNTYMPEIITDTNYLVFGYGSDTIKITIQTDGS